MVQIKIINAQTLIIPFKKCNKAHSFLDENSQTYWDL